MMSHILNNLYSILGVILAIIGLLIAYYGLIYNRPRVECDFICEYYDLKDRLIYTKILFRNTGTLTAFNIKIKNLNKSIKPFIYPENNKKYNKLEIIFDEIDTLNIDFDSEKINELNKKIQNIDNKIEYIQPNFFSKTHIKISENNLIVEKIKERERSINSFFNTKINILLPNQDKIAHLTDHDIKTQYGTLNLEELNFEISYEQIESISPLHFIFFLKKIKFDFLITSKIDIKTKSKIKTITEIKSLRLVEKIKKEDFFINQKINNERFNEYRINEFNKFLNSFKFTNWYNSLNNFEKSEMTTLLNNINYESHKYLTALNDIMKKESKTNKLFIKKYIVFLNLLKELPYLEEEYSINLRFEMYNVEAYLKNNIKF